MSNRNNYDSQNNKNPNRHIKNTDNERTQYISHVSDNEQTAQFSVNGYENRPYTDQNGSQYYNNDPYNYTEGRRQYYNSPDGDINGTRYGYGGERPQYGSAPRQGQQRNPNQGRPQQQRGPAQGRPTQQQRPRSSGDGRPPQGSRRPQQNNGNRQRRNPEYPPPQRRTAPPPQQQRMQKPKKRRKKSIIARVITVLLTIVVIVFALYSAASLFVISKLNFQESADRSHVSGALSESYVTSVLLIGTDGRSLDERGRSDTMILLSINKKKKEITLTSFMRDSYVNIPGYGWNKLNAAYSFGGADLLMDTIEQNFSVRIDDYVAVNFISFAAIIDSVGGIEIDVSDAEAGEINTILMAEVNEIMGDAVDADLLNSGGKLQLNGKQALSYARIRYIGNADFERTQRQREVLTQVAGKLKSLKPSMISNVAKKAVPQITTNMSKGELYMLSLRLPFVLGYEITQLRVPSDNTYVGASHECGDSLDIDFNANYDIIREEVFGE